MRALPASEPEEGSVSPQAPMNSPVASLLTYFFFCVSLPARKMWLEQSEVCAATMMPTEPSTRDKLLNGGDVLDVSHARAAVLGGKDHAQQAELA